MNDPEFEEDYKKEYEIQLKKTKESGLYCSTCVNPYPHLICTICNISKFISITQIKEIICYKCDNNNIKCLDCDSYV